jgi:small GTP-binding protein
MQTYTLKFVMVGDSGVGKSQLLRRFVRKDFSHDPKSTLNMEFSTRDIPFERCIVKAQIWDTVGQERFESLTKAYYRDAMGALLIYDITNKQSFENMKSVWHKQLKEYGHERMQIVVVGNKHDDAGDESKRQVSIKEATEFARANRMDFAETSALSNSKVEAVFRRMILTVAPVIPDISAHLGLTDLPDGWIRVSRTDAGSVGGSPKLNNDVESNDAHLAVPTEVPTDDSDEGNMSEQFMNYWTGEVTLTEPAAPADSGMIVNADPRQSTVSSSFYQRTSLHMSDKENLRDMHIAGAGSDEDVDFDNTLKGKCSNCNIL